mmetsp:Transcript_31401/g.47902  ORF Transcript_31401/g.47902 Transcript_31401/m.47902 type:complete len:143 (-) Transcript_31401:3-431(-)
MLLLVFSIPSFFETICDLSDEISGLVAVLIALRNSSLTKTDGLLFDERKTATQVASGWSCSANDGLNLLIDPISAGQRGWNLSKSEKGPFPGAVDKHLTRAAILKSTKLQSNILDPKEEGCLLHLLTNRNIIIIIIIVPLQN